MGFSSALHHECSFSIHFNVLLWKKYICFALGGELVLVLPLCFPEPEPLQREFQLEATRGMGVLTCYLSQLAAYSTGNGNHRPWGVGGECRFPPPLLEGCSWSREWEGQGVFRHWKVSADFMTCPHFLGLTMFPHGRLWIRIRVNAFAVVTQRAPFALLIRERSRASWPEPGPCLEDSLFYPVLPAKERKVEAHFVLTGWRKCSARGSEVSGICCWHQGSRVPRIPLVSAGQELLSSKGAHGNFHWS